MLLHATSLLYSQPQERKVYRTIFYITYTSRPYTHAPNAHRSAVVEDIEHLYILIFTINYLKYDILWLNSSAALCPGRATTAQSALRVSGLCSPVKRVGRYGYYAGNGFILFNTTFINGIMTFDPSCGVAQVFTYHRHIDTSTKRALRSKTC